MGGSRTETRGTWASKGQEREEKAVPADPWWGLVTGAGVLSSTSGYMLRGRGVWECTAPLLLPDQHL